MGEILFDQLLADRIPIASQDHQVAAMPVLPLKPVGNHLEFAIVQQLHQPSGRAPTEVGFHCAVRASHFRRIYPGDADRPIAKFEGVAVEDTGSAATWCAIFERRRNPLSGSERTDWADQLGIEQSAGKQQDWHRPKPITNIPPLRLE